MRGNPRPLPCLLYTSGTDFNRLNLLLAVLEKRLGMHFSECDAYVNIAGGMRINEPALDLGIMLALVSSYYDREIDEKTIIFGEVGLSGEVRAVTAADQRVSEALKLGFHTCILPRVKDVYKRQQKRSMRRQPSTAIRLRN